MRGRDAHVSPQEARAPARRERITCRAPAVPASAYARESEQCLLARPALQAKVMVDKYTGRSRGFGFVTFETSEAATNAIEAMNGQVSGGYVALARSNMLGETGHQVRVLARDSTLAQDQYGQNANKIASSTAFPPAGCRCSAVLAPWCPGLCLHCMSLSRPYVLIVSLLYASSWDMVWSYAPGRDIRLYLS